MTDPIALTAIHEAGHVVTALSLNRDVQRVSIKPQGCELGFTLVGTHPHQPGAAIEDALIRLAGPAAQRRYAPGAGYIGESADEAEVAEIVGSLCSSSGESALLLRWLRLRAASMVGAAAFWPACSAVAGALLERGELKGHEASSIARWAGWKHEEQIQEDVLAGAVSAYT